MHAKNWVLDHFTRVSLVIARIFSLKSRFDCLKA